MSSSDSSDTKNKYLLNKESEGNPRVLHKKRKHSDDENVDDLRNLPGPSGVAPTKPPQKVVVHKIARKRMKQRRRASNRDPRSNFRSEDYQLSDWFTQEMPQKRYFPQIGDDIVYFRQGHDMYLSIVKLKYPRYYVPTEPVPWSWLDLSIQEYCRVVNVEFVMQPARMCKIQLRVAWDQPQGGQRFTIFYHPVPEAMDFLVLKDVINVSKVNSYNRWRVGRRFRCAMPNNIWCRGTITAIGPLEQQFPESRFLRYRVRWDDDTVGRLSAWDLEHINYESRVTPRHTNIQMRREELDAWQRILRRGCGDWPLGDRDLFLKAITPELELLLDLMIFEPFVDARHERMNPAYLRTIAYPIDISLIMLRLDSGFYRRMSSLLFDISYLLRNAMKFYPSSHILAKIATWSTELLLKIVRGNGGRPPLRILDRPSLGVVHYTETDTDEETEKIRKLKQLKKKKRKELSPIVIVISDTDDLEEADQSSQLPQQQPGMLSEMENAEVNASQNNEKIASTRINLSDDIKFPMNSPKYYNKENIQPVVVVQPNEVNENEQAIIQANENDNNQPTVNRSQEHDSNRSQPLASLDAKMNCENHPTTNRTQNHDSGNSSSLTLPTLTRNERMGSEAKDRCRQDDENIENHPPSGPVSHSLERDSVNDSPMTVLRLSEKAGSQPSMNRRNYEVVRIKKYPHLKGPPSRCSTPSELELNRTRAQQRAIKKKGPRHRLILKEHNVISNENQHQDQSHTSLGIDNVNWSDSSINSSQERVHAPPPLDIDQHRLPCEPTSPVQNQSSTSQRQESTDTSSSDLEINQNRSLLNKFEVNHPSTSQCQEPLNLEIDRSPSSSSNEDLHLGDSEMSNNETSDLGKPKFFTSKYTPRTTGAYKMCKMKKWRSGCMKVLQLIWEDEDSAIFRESAMENHRRSVIEWISLEYIMDLLKCGGYRDPNEVVDDVQTMLLNGRSLISAGNEDIARIIDELSLWFDELIYPVLRKWRRTKRKQQATEESEGETESDLTISETTSTSSATFESMSSSSPV